ncbi:TRAP transporter large permease [Aquamicrobium sp. LC103]|uniref:TRAP transporter large permease n=1 Tax=Aquamicrobium sp. LC103 TaxID=1120658 RepID=UPI00063EBE21|nr:TRAP transporter large permease [Aquamicrobium sp. LC103]TKT69228.1 TRAP transporter large permease [Aquamicrobium sp. LC103]
MAAEIVMYMVGLLVVLVLLGFHIAVALAMTSVLGIYLMMGSFDVAVSLLGSSAYEAIRSHTFIVIPLFVLMGDFVSKSGAAGDLYQVCNRLLRRVSGRLAVATVAGNAIFAAVTGVSVASAAAFSRIAYPEMRRLGYQREYAVGVVAGSACLGMLIPPSVLLIVWAILTEASVGKLFIAGVLPGIILAIMFAAYCVVHARMRPDVAPNPPAAEDITPLARGEIFGALGIFALVVLVIGGLWGGVFNPTEAAGFGTIGALVLGVAKGMRGREVMQAIYSAARTTGPIMLLLIAATMYSRLLAMGGAVNYIQNLFFGLGGGTIVIVAVMIIIWIILGMLIDSISIILLTVPIFAPIALALGLDSTAFAIFGILVIEAGLLTPPFGLVVYTVKGAVPDPSVKLKHVFKGSFPFCVMILIAALLVILFPQLATWLPSVTF